jgi:hypothetical protein
MPSLIQRLVPSKPEGPWFVCYAMLMAFLTYSCMYALRRPFTVGTFEGMTAFGFDYKILLILLQGFGYLLSKFIGIKVVSEMGPNGRPRAIILLTGIAGLALIAFAVAPYPWNSFFLLLNGLPLGMIWGLVFSYLEGRRSTELLGAGLCVSFIFSSGFVKSAGMAVMIHWGVSEFWMPAVTGGLFYIPLVILVFLLNQVPPPSAEDIRERALRSPMPRAARAHLFREYATGIILLVIVYTLLTIYRDYRDNFAADVWIALGYGDRPELFTVSEIPISLGILAAMGLVMLIRNNALALMVNHAMIFVGLLGGLLATILFEQGILPAPAWIILVGLGLYLGYVPFNAFLFERFMATFRHPGNACFLIYVADAFGYLGSFGTLIYKNFLHAGSSPLSFFTGMSYWVGGLGSALTLASGFYFAAKARRLKQRQMETSGGSGD